MTGAPESSRRASTRAMDPTRRSPDCHVGTTSPSRMVVPDAGCSTCGTEPCARELDSPAATVRTLAFASLARPGTAVLAVEGAAFEDRATGPLVLRLPPDGPADAGDRWQRARQAGGVAVAASERAGARQARGFGSSGSWRTPPIPQQAPRPEAALEALEAAERIGVEALLAEQRSAWARRWSAADIRIEGDPDLQRAVRFSPVPPDGLRRRSPRGRARGEGAQRPRLPRARLLGHRRLRAAVPRRDPPAGRRVRSSATASRVSPRRERAAARGGFEGARFPWESADTGDDITPAWLRGCERQARARPDRRAGGAHHRRRRVGDGALPEPGAATAQMLPACRELLVRDRALLGLADPRRRRRPRPHRRRHRPGRVPRERRRQRVHERHGAVEPRPRRRPRGRARRPAAGARSPPPSSTGSTLRPAATSSSRGTSGSSR